MKPVIVVTVHRRYYELELALARIRELAHEFSEAPDVVVVWACPEVGRLWFFRGLREQGLITHLLPRLPLPDETQGGSSTYPESQNIRLGLSFVRDNYPADRSYALVQTADIQVKAAVAYADFDAHMNRGVGAIVLHWANGCVQSHIWHTNFFAVRLDPIYWPPLSTPEHQDVLEWQWGKQLLETQPPDVLHSHNYNDKRFVHVHLSEGHAPWPVMPERDGVGLSCVLFGWKPWWARLADWCTKFLRAPRHVNPKERPDGQDNRDVRHGGQDAGVQCR